MSNKTTGIAISLVSRPQSLTEQIRAKGVSFGPREEDGVMCVTLNVPGVAPVTVDQEDLTLIVSTLDRHDIADETPGAVFSRSATVDGEGNLSAKLSDAKRSRSLHVPASERENLANFLVQVRESFADFQRQYDDAQDTSDDQIVPEE